MQTKRLIASTVSVTVVVLAGCNAQQLSNGLAVAYANLTAEVPGLCPPPAIEREEFDLPGFGTMVRYTNPIGSLESSALNNRNQFAADAYLSWVFTCTTAVVVGEGVEILARPNVATFVDDLNDGGIAVGQYRFGSRKTSFAAAAWRDGAFIPLPVPDGLRGMPMAVNNNDVIVGMILDDEGREFVRWEPEGDTWTMTRLGVRGATPSDVNVNDHGEIVGVLTEPLPSDPDVTLRRPFIWQDGNLTILPTLAGAGTGFSVRVLGLNNSGWIVGSLDLPSDEALGEDERPVERAVVWRDGQVIELESLGGRTSIANDVNESGQIVGSSSNTAGGGFACMWEDGVLLNLNDLLPVELGIMLSSGRAINDEGVILARNPSLVADVHMLIPSSAE